MLNVKPVSSVRKPKLPTKAEFETIDRLADHMPIRWKLNATVLTAALMAAVPTAWGQERQVLPGDIAPVSFLSETQAAKAIREEAKKYGIDFGQSHERLKFPLACDYSKPGKPRTKNVSKTLDGTDSKRGISFEYVTDADADKLNATKEQVVQALKKELKRAGKTKKVAVFEAHPSMDLAAQEKNLRKEVRTFLEWLKGQGII